MSRSTPPSGGNGEDSLRNGGRQDESSVTLNATVLVVDPDSSARQALGRLLGVAGYRVQALSSAEQLLALPRATEPACAVLDVNLPGLSGLELQSGLRERGDSLPVVFVTGQGDVRTTVRAMKLGAEDFLTRPVGDEELLDAVRRGIARHRAALSREEVLAELRRRAGSLSPRQRQVFALVAGGLPNKRIGALLGVREKTIKVHRGSVMRRMQAQSLPDLVRMAMQLGEVRSAEPASR